MQAIKYAVKHRRYYRTRINFPFLRRRAELCIAVEKKLTGISGVTMVKVRSNSGSVIIEHPDGMLPIATIHGNVSKTIAGFQPSPETPYIKPEKSIPCCSCNNKPEKKNRINHVSGPLLIFSGIYILYLLGKSLFTATSVTMTIAARVFSLPAIVAFGLSLPIQHQALENLKKTGRPDMGLISTGLLYISILTGNVLASLTVFWLFNLSSWLEDRIKTNTRQAVREMLTGRQKKVWLLKEDLEIEVETKSLIPGDIISLGLGDTIPVDGTIIRGNALVNEATLTGESLPVTRTTEDEVLAGTTIESGEVRVRVDRAGEETRLAAIIRLIETAENDPGELQRTSQKFSQVMVPISLGLAGAAFLFTGNLLQAMAVLIITCPCALRLSTSVAVSSAMSRAAREGILIKGGRYVEIAGMVNVLVLDKTGTLTAASSEVMAISAMDKRYKTKTILQLAASVQKKWYHPLSRAVVRKAEEKNLLLLPCEQTELITGRGTRAIIKNREILVGSLKFMEERLVPCSSVKKQQKEKNLDMNTGILYVASAGHIIGRLEVKSKIQGDIFQALQKIRAMGIKHIVLLTGDNQAGTEQILKKFDFDEVSTGQSPEDKAAWINNWKKQHPEDVVAMVGDGINDTPAFAAADLSLAMGEGGADVTVEYADIVLQPGSINQVTATLALGRQTLRVIKESYTIAIGLNAATLTGTTLGIISPITGALVHNMITIAAVSNAATTSQK